MNVGKLFEKSDGEQKLCLKLSHWQVEPHECFLNFMLMM